LHDSAQKPLCIEATRIVCGMAEKAIVGQSLGAAAVKGASPLSDNGYKVPRARGIVEETLTAPAV